jgi:hypothetical protein
LIGALFSTLFRSHLISKKTEKRKNRKIKKEKTFSIFNEILFVDIYVSIAVGLLRDILERIAKHRLSSRWTAAGLIFPGPAILVTFCEDDVLSFHMNKIFW